MVLDPFNGIVFSWHLLYNEEGKALYCTTTHNFCNEFIMDYKGDKLKAEPQSDILLDHDNDRTWRKERGTKLRALAMINLIIFLIKKVEKNTCPTWFLYMSAAFGSNRWWLMRQSWLWMIAVAIWRSHAKNTFDWVLYMQNIGFVHIQLLHLKATKLLRLKASWIMWRKT